MSHNSSFKREKNNSLLPLTITTNILQESDTAGELTTKPTTRVNQDGRCTDETFMANAALLAFMHDLVAQSPLTTEPSQSREKLLYEHLHDLERRFRDGELRFDDKQVRELRRTNGYLLYRNEATSDVVTPRAKCFNFIPSGTRELFLDWPARRDAIKRYSVASKKKVYEVCVPRNHADWLSEKISLNRVPFDIDLYDPCTYFALQAAIMRLLRRNLQVQLFSDREWSIAQLSSYMDNSALASQCKPTYSPQDCLLSWLQVTYGNIPRGDTALHIAQQRLFSSDNVSRVVRWLVFITLERLASSSSSLSNVEKVNDQEHQMAEAESFVSIASQVYSLLANVPHIEKRTAIQYHLLTALESKQSRIQFDRRLYTDYRQWKKQESDSGAVTVDRRVFIAAEALRWNVFFFSGWDKRAVESLPLKRLVVALETIYVCLPERRLVIDADVLRRYAAHNIDTLLLTSDSTNGDVSNVDVSACTVGPSLNGYASILSAAKDRAEQNRLLRQKAKKSAQPPLPTQPKSNQHTEKHKKGDEVAFRRENQTKGPAQQTYDALHTGGLFYEPHERFDMQEPLEIQRIVWTMRDTVQRAKDATASEQKQWLRGLYTIYSGTYSKKLQELSESWIELHSLLQLLLPPHDVPVENWTDWQQTIRNLYNGSQVSEETANVFNSVDIPLAYMNEDQFFKNVTPAP